MVLMLLYGIPLTAFQTGVTTVLQETVEENMMGRVFGPLADVMSLRVLMAASNAALLMLCLPLAAGLRYLGP